MEYTVIRKDWSIELETTSQQEINEKINVTLEQCPNCEHCLVHKPNCRIIKILGYIVFYGKNGECTFFKRKVNNS